MIITKERSNPITSGIKTEVGFTIDPRNLAHVVGLLRDAYSDPITAVLREYSVNAYDSHVEAGIPERPIVVTLPTKLEPHLSIRDYGKGLTPEQIESLFCSYGASSKRDSNDYTGCLGIGCKSAFAITDSFTVTTFHGGKARIYNCYLDESEVGKAALLSEKKSTETGLLVQIPIKREDIEDLQEKSAKVFRYFKTKPTVENLSKDYLSTMERPRYGFSGKDWRIVLGREDEESTDSLVVMGNIAYPLDTDQLSESSQKFLQQDIEIDFKLGELDIAPSREELKYNARTKKAINDRIEALAKEIAENAAIDIGKAKSMWEACKIFRSTFGRGNFGELLKKYHKPTYKGKPLKDSLMKLPETAAKRKEHGLEVFALSKLRWSRRGKDYDMSDGQDYIDPSFGSKVYLDKSSGVREWSGRVRTLVRMPDFQQAYIIKSRNGGLDWLLKNSPEFDGMPLEDFEKLAVTAPDPKSSGVAGLKDAEASAKHSRSAFVLDEKELENWQRMKSKYWKPSTVNLDEGGVYLEIENFKLVNHHGSQLCPRDIQRAIDFAREELGFTGKVYGFKKDILEKIRKSKTKVWFSFEDKFKELLEAKGESWLVDMYKALDYENGYNKQFLRQHGTLLNHSTPGTSAHTLGEALKYIASIWPTFKNKQEKFQNLCQNWEVSRKELIGAVLYKMKVAVPESFNDLRDKFIKEYPMAKDWSHWNNDNHFADSDSKTSTFKAAALSNYVSLIDNQNKKKG